jgi:hypothetical protein
VERCASQRSTRVPASLEPVRERTCTVRGIAPNIRLLASAGALMFVSSGYGQSSSVKVLALVAGLLVLLPWLVTRQTLSVSPLTLTGILFGLAGVMGSGGHTRLALISLLLLLPSGLVAGSYLASSGIARLVASASIALTQWIPIVAQRRNPYLVLEKLGAQSFEVGFRDIPLSQVSNLRPVGTTVSPGLVAFILLVGIALALVPGLDNNGLRTAIWCLAVGHAWCLLVTGSRTGIASLAILLAWSWRGSRRMRLSLRAVAILTGSVAVSFLSGSSGRVSPETRLDIIHAAMPTLRKTWILGVGWGNTPMHVSTAADGIVYHLHLLPLHILFELGLCGAVGLVLLAMQLARRSLLAIVVLLPFALTDAGVFISASTIFFLGVIIEVASSRTHIPAAARGALSAL